jgi:uncharacterized protein (DUF1697 family)
VKAYIALFRGINVGGKNRLPMKDLVGILEDIGCKHIQTYIQSGNVVFRAESDSAKQLAAQIGQRIMESHGFEPKVMLLEISEFHNAVENNPFSTEKGRALHFYFLDSHPEDPDLESLQAVKSETETYKLLGKVFYLYAPDGIGRSRLAARVERALGVPVTARNWNTVSKLLSMLEG